MNLIINTLPYPSDPRPAGTHRVAYGNIPHERRRLWELSHPDGRPGQTVFRGRSFLVPSGGTSTASKITPDPETGIGAWSRYQFIPRFKRYDERVDFGEENTVMPGTLYVGTSGRSTGTSGARSPSRTR